MTQEEKELLLKDLSSRLPYGVIVNVKRFDYDYNDKLTQIYKGYGCSIQVTTNMPYDIEQVKPYLVPMSSMTEEQREELFTVVLDEQVSISDCSFNDMTGYSEILTSYIIDAIDWLNKNHFDFRGLIPKGLALDATGLNIY